MTIPDLMGTRRPDLNNALLLKLVVAIAIATVASALMLAMLPAEIRRPGSVWLQTSAALGSLCLLVPFAFAANKRSGHASLPNRGFVAHVLASSIGVVLVCIHALSRLSGPPLLLLLALFGLLASGLLGRVLLASQMAATLGSKTAAFAPSEPTLRAQLSALIEHKRVLLTRLDPAADEALFSVTLIHWIRSPWLSWCYARLVAQEAKLIGNRASVGKLQAWWRPLHILLAWGFLGGLLAHIIVVLFFAGYVADGGDIYWWHISAW